MRADSWRIFRYGSKFKVIYYKTAPYSRVREKTELERLAAFYLENRTAGLNPNLWKLYDDGFEASEILRFHDEKLDRLFPRSEVSPDERLSQSISRAKSRIYELALCNEFQYFCTFTQSPDLRDRFDLRGFRKDFAMFVRNQNRARDSPVRYLLVPERHKDGAWHMHGLLMGLSEKDLSENEHGYLDWLLYRRKFGFFSCSPVRDSSACAAYVTKYVTKDMANQNMDAFGHLYFASQGLKRREQISSGFGRECPIDSFDFENDYVKISWLDRLPNGMS